MSTVDRSPASGPNGWGGHTVENELRDFIQAEIGYEGEQQIEADEPLLDGGLDSTGVLRLVVFVEERFGVWIEDDELVPENFATVRSLAELVAQKTGHR